MHGINTAVVATSVGRVETFEDFKELVSRAAAAAGISPAQISVISIAGLPEDTRIAKARRMLHISPEVILQLHHRPTRETERILTNEGDSFGLSVMLGENLIAQFQVIKRPDYRVPYDHLYPPP